MAERFDPYLVWLGIPPQQQPPNFYQLLGIPQFTDNVDVIENAADRQMAHLRTFQNGPHSDLSQKLLNEVSAARVGLLNPEKRAAYEQQLRQQMMPPAAASNAETNNTLDIIVPKDKKRGARKPNRKAARPGLYLGIMVSIVVLAIIAAMLVAREHGRRILAEQTSAVAEQPVTIQPAPKTVNPPAEVSKTEPDVKAEPSVATPPVPTPTPPQVVAPKPVAPPDLPDPPNVENPDPPSEEQQADPFALPLDVEEPERITIPSEDVQRQITEQLIRIHDLNKRRTSQEKVKLAAEWFTIGKNSENDDEKYVLLDKAAKLAAECGDAARALTIVDKLGETFQIDLLQAKADVLQDCATAATTPADIADLVKNADAVIDAALDEEQFDLAVDLAAKVYRACSKSCGKEFRKQALQRRKQVEDLAQPTSEPSKTKVVNDKPKQSETDQQTPENAVPLANNSKDKEKQSRAIQWKVSEGGNGHWYEAVLADELVKVKGHVRVNGVNLVNYSGGITWLQARDAAKAKGGWLADITSSAENSFVFHLVEPRQHPEFWYPEFGKGVGLGPWLGGFQPKRSLEPAGNWRWITGIKITDSRGSSKQYTNWITSNPSDHYQIVKIGPPEDALHFYGKSPKWNDIPSWTVLNGYVVEYAVQPPIR